MAKKPVVLKVQNGGCFDDLDVRDDEELTLKTGRPLDMFKQVLPSLDRRNFDFYSKCSVKEQKSYAPLVVMRWMSATNGDYDATHHYHLLNVNAYVNVDFWTLSSHHDLQHRLLALCGTGQSQRHNWIPMIKKTKKKSKVDDFLVTFFPRLNELELTIMKKTTSVEEYESFLSSRGLQVADVKKRVREWKAELKKGF